MSGQSRLLAYAVWQGTGKCKIYHARLFYSGTVYVMTRLCILLRAYASGKRTNTTFLCFSMRLTTSDCQAKINQWNITQMPHYIRHRPPANRSGVMHYAPTFTAVQAYDVILNAPTPKAPSLHDRQAFTSFSHPHR